MNYDVLKLIDMALKGRDFAYAPYSKFKVGACALTKDGKYFYGCNIENASYPNGNCAERTALFKLYSEGYTKDDVIAFAIVGQSARPISPCGMCRQVMSELLNPDTPIIMATLDKEYKISNMKELLPYSFSGDDL
jgi:cytidine deaminase